MHRSILLIVSHCVAAQKRSPGGCAVESQYVGLASGTWGQSVVGKWELLYQLNDKGERQNPRDLTKTQIEFTDNGQVVFNRIDNENADNVKSRTGKFTVDKNQISITDDAGNTVKWPFQIASDSLIISMPESTRNSTGEGSTENPAQTNCRSVLVCCLPVGRTDIR